jgi:hypothetical protein
MATDDFTANAERVAEERGLVRWLRPEHQAGLRSIRDF